MVEVSNGVAGAEQLRRTLSVKHSMRIPRKLSRTLVRAVDPEGVDRRKNHRLRRRQYMSKGPNYVWHMDGYDKLAPYGICIHGCIDGFSRKIIWLKAGITNRKPEVVASYFLEAVAEEGGFPAKVRADHGGENTAVATVQQAVYENNRAFIYGRSTANQRIEHWWAYLRNARSDIWRHEFKVLERDNIIDRGNCIHRLCLQYSFILYIAKQLEELKVLWNTHSIRQQRHGDCIPGIPIILHSEGNLYDVQNYKHSITVAEMDMLQDQYENSFLELDDDFKDIIVNVRRTNNFPQPEEINLFEEAKALYIQLSSFLENL